MEIVWPEMLAADKKKAAKELVEGREFANQLQSILSESDGPVQAGDLVGKILISFTNALSSILNFGMSDEVSDIPTSCFDARKSQDSRESRKSSTVKNRRGCYKRRKNSHTWTKVTPILTDDGYAWRKYGQKVILNTKYPRDYFRCTHGTNQGCQATKQVQRVGEYPPMFRTTYHGHHTCKNLLKAPQILLDSTPPDHDPSVLLSFNAPGVTTKQDHPFFSSFASVKQEYRVDIATVDMTCNRSSSSDYLLSPPDLTAFDQSPIHTSVISEVNSCTDSSLSLYMDVMVGSVDFVDVLQF